MLENQIENDANMSRNKQDIETRIEKESTLLSNVGLDSINEQESEIWGEADSDDDYEMLREFDVQKAWKSLLSIHDCMKIPLSVEAQKKLKLEIGKNVTQEFPWRQIKLKDLFELFDDDLEVENLKKSFNIENLGELHNKFTDIKSTDYILVGYLSTFESDNDDNDYFIIYGSHESARNAGKIIENIEKYERWFLNKTLLKKNRTWISRGSEKEVDLVIPQEREQIVDVEFQSVYPIRRKEIHLSERLANDIRDGYVELLPGDKKFENVFRRRIDVGIQSNRKRIILEQQTDPTFPSNAWSQYTYEIDQNEQSLDNSDDEVDGETKEKEDTKSSVKGISLSPNLIMSASQAPASTSASLELSERFEYLIETIKFNQVDMYRNDYASISLTPVKKREESNLEEALSFAGISRSLNRMICAVDWYPTISGILVASYTLTNLVTSISVNEDLDLIKKTILEPSPVLMWSFSDSLEYKLEFETQREVTVLSFCPFDQNILLGGTINGTIIIWDLQNRLEKLDKDEILTEKQRNCRLMIQNYLNWTKIFNENILIHPAAVSSLQDSQNGPITAIKWFDRNCSISQTGHIRKTNPGTSKYFITVSLDGSVAFWYIDSEVEFKKTKNAIKDQLLPSQLIQNLSVYKKYDRVIKPIYIVEFTEPITGVLMDSGKFHYEPKINEYSAKILNNINTRIPIQVTPILRDDMKQTLNIVSLYGQIITGNWEGLSHSASEISKEKVITTIQFAKIHNGPIIGIQHNPFIEEIFVTFGGTIFAVWERSIIEKPIIWRQVHTKITQMRWSTDRPAVIFLTTDDGIFQVWDLLSRSESSSLSEIISGGIISSLSEPKISFPRKVISIGDYNSSLKIYYLPSNFHILIPNEFEIGMALVKHARRRQQNILLWRKTWLEKNADIIDAKKAQEEEKQKELERLQKEIQEQTILKQKRTEEEKKKAEQEESKKKTHDLSEILQKRWDEFNLKRIMETLLTRRHLDPIKLEKDTAFEKERLNYIKEKKDAIKKSYLAINDDLSKIRSKILPIQKIDLHRTDLVYESTIKLIHIQYEKFENYEQIEDNMNLYIEEHPSLTDISQYDFYMNGKYRRDMINRSLTEHINKKRHQYYENMKLDTILSVCDFGKKRFLNNIMPQLQQLQQQKQYENKNTIKNINNKESSSIKTATIHQRESENLLQQQQQNIDEEMTQIMKDQINKEKTEYIDNKDQTDKKEQQILQMEEVLKEKI